MGVQAVKHFCQRATGMNIATVAKHFTSGFGLQDSGISGVSLGSEVASDFKRGLTLPVEIASLPEGQTPIGI
jgi:hypothetical protein